MGVSAIVGRLKKNDGGAVFQTSPPSLELAASWRADGCWEEGSRHMADWTPGALSTPNGNGFAPTEPDMLGATHASAVWGTAPAQISCASQRARQSAGGRPRGQLMRTAPRGNSSTTAAP